MARDPGFRPTDDSIDKLTVMRAKLSDYSLLLNQLLKVYGGPSTEHSHINDAYTNVKQAYILSDILLGKTRPATEQDLKNFQDKWIHIAQSMEGLNKLAANSMAMKKILDRLAAETNVNLDDLHATAQSIAQAAQGVEMKPESFKDYMKREHRDTYGEARAGGQDILNQALGPYAAIGKAAWGAISGIKGWRDAKKTRAKREGYWNQYGPSGYNFSTGQSTGFGGEKGTGSGIGDIFNEARGDGKSGFEDFFDSKAYKARYTKELLKSIKDLKGDKSGGGGKSGMDLGDIAGMGMIIKYGRGALAFLAGPAGIWIVGAIVATLLATVGARWLGAHWDGIVKGAGDIAKGTGDLANKAGKTAVSAGAGAWNLAATPAGMSVLTGGAMGGAVAFGAALANPKRAVPTAEELRAAGPFAGLVSMMSEVVNTIKDSVTTMTKSIAAGSSQSTVIASKGASASPYRNADPLIDNTNKNSE